MLLRSLRHAALRTKTSVAGPSPSSLSSSSSSPPPDHSLAYNRFYAPKLLYAGAASLHREALPVLERDFDSERMRNLVVDMYSVLERDELQPSGLAAPQVGESLQVMAVQYKAAWITPQTRQEDRERGIKPVPLTFIVNPKLTFVNKETTLDWEACLSVPGYTGLVPRAKVVEITGRDLQNRPVRFIGRDFTARILQHEYDHLKGILFTERMFANTFRHIENTDEPMPDELEPPSKPPAFASL